MANFQQQPPTRIKLRRDAIIHAIAFHDEMYAVGDDEALTVVDAATDHSIRRFEDMGTVLSVCFVGDRVAAGTLRGVVALRKLCDHETWDGRCGCGSDELALAPAGAFRQHMTSYMNPAGPPWPASRVPPARQKTEGQHL